MGQILLGKRAVEHGATAILLGVATCWSQGRAALSHRAIRSAQDALWKLCDVISCTGAVKLGEEEICLDVATCMSELTAIAGAAAVGPTIHAIASVVVLAPAASVRAALTGARAVGAGAVGPAVDADTRICREGHTDQQGRTDSLRLLLAHHSP